MDGVSLLLRARAAGIAVAAEGNKLVIRGPKRAEPVAHLLIEHKPEVLAALASAGHLTRAVAADVSTGIERLLCNTEIARAAIIENAGNTPRPWREGFARLDPDCPPGDVPLRRWQTLIDDIGRVFDAGFVGKAAGLGWGPHELFGADRDRPFARIGQQGLCWLISGNRVVDLSEEKAVIEIWTTGTRQTYRRHKPHAPGVVLPWELAP